MSFLRDLSAASAHATLDAAKPWIPLLVAVGLDSTEIGNPPEKFSDVYDRAREMGLRLVAHAGEEGGSELVTRTLDVLRVDRVDHGVRSADDPDLIARLAAEKIPLTVCPLSNTKLRVFSRMEDSTLKQLLDAGVAVTVNSDDPAYFGGYIGSNYRAVASGLGLDVSELVTLARNAIVGSFAGSARKETLLAELESVAVAF